MRRRAALDGALARAPGPVTRIPPVSVKVRAIEGKAIAYTPTHVLVEWVRYGEYHVRWEAKWQVRRV